MARLLDAVSLLLLVGAAAAFAMGVGALRSAQDLECLYWLVVGGLTLRASVDVVRPKVGVR